MPSVAERPQSRPGYTLIDLVVSVLVMGILAAGALPRFSSALVKNRVACAALRMCADIKLARSAAIAASATRRIDLVIADSKYTIVGLSSPDRPGPDYSVTLTDQYQTSIVSTTLTGDPSFSFDLHGQPSRGATIVIQSGAEQKTITVDAATGDATSS